MLNETMEALAHRGDMLILGRGGYAALSKYADVFSVRLQAPFSVRGDSDGQGKPRQSLAS